MKYTQNQYIVLSKKAIAKNIFDMEINAKDIAEVAQAGQFVHVLAKGFALRRPISLAEINKNAGTIRIIFEAKGDGTKEIADTKIGESIDVLGPLGHGFSILDTSKKAICVGGGIGVPPMLPLAQIYGKNGTVISGFRNSSLVILQDDFSKTGCDNILCTDDGSAGIKGFVTQSLEEKIIFSRPDIIYACGPKVMLKAVAEIAKKYDIKCEISLEERMGCGIGACLVCACKTQKNGEEKMSHVCKDGPVFDAKEVMF